MKFNFFSEVLVSRSESNSQFPLIIHTLSLPAYHIGDIRKKMKELKEKYASQLENLFGLEGSGIAIQHIKNLRLQIAVLPFVKSGCLNTRIGNSLSKALIRGVTLITSTSNNCLIEAISCIINFDVEKKRLLDITVKKCSSCSGKSCKICLAKHNSIWNEEKKKEETWTKHEYIKNIGSTAKPSR